MVVLDHPDNPRFPTPWYASNRADTYGEGWANFVNAAFLWDEPLTVEPDAPLQLRYRVLVHDGALGHRPHRARVRAMGDLITDSRALGDALLEFTVDAVQALATAHFPDWRIPHTFAGHASTPTCAPTCSTRSPTSPTAASPRSRASPSTR